MTKRFATMAALRADLGAALDHAERGETVEIERRGKLFLLQAARVSATQEPKAWIEVLDPDLLEKGWTWDYDGRSMKLLIGGKPAKPMKPRRRSRK